MRSPDYRITTARGTVTADRAQLTMIVAPADLVSVLADGEAVVRDGAPVRPHGSLDPDDPRLGIWHDPAVALDQILTPDGRYTETRNGRRDAYTGRFWLDGDRITYLDDQGFWAFGRYDGDVLHHAHFVLRRR